MWPSSPAPHILAPYFTRSVCRDQPQRSLSASEATSSRNMPYECKDDAAATRDCKTAASMTSTEQPMSDIFSSPSTVHYATVNDSSLTPAPFTGAPTDNCRDWIEYFKRFAHFKQLSAPAVLDLFALVMRGAANTWFTSLDEHIRSDLKAVIAAFETRYLPPPISRWKRAAEFWQRDQRSNESVEDYVADMMQKARDVGADDNNDTTRYAIMKGLRASLRSYVMQQNPRSTAELLEAAKVAEATIVEPSSAPNTEILDAISRLEQRVTNAVDNTRRVRFNRSPSNERRGTPPPSNYRNRQPRRLPSPSPRRTWNQPPLQQPVECGPPPMMHAPQQPMFTPPPQQMRYNRQATGCTYCAKFHAHGNCIARGKQCRKCGKPNHFAICCRSRPRNE